MRRRSNGFTVIEMMVVILILATLAAVLLPALHRAREVRCGGGCANNLKQFGLSLKMYAMESSGGLYPPLQVEVTHPDHVNPDNPESSIWNSFTYEFTPRISSIYPEYFSDIKVMICREDETHPFNNREDLTCVLQDNSWDEGSTDPDRQQDGCMDEMDNSYIYLNWVFDKIDKDDPVTAQYPLQLQNSWHSIGQKIDFSSQTGKEPAWFPTQFVATLTAAQNKSFATFDDAYTNTNYGHQRFLDPWDEDVTLDNTVIDAFDVATDYGNHSTNVVSRLREGVQRFFTADATNSDDLARIASEIPVLMDRPGRHAADYSHVPGGANVLFMDGHVEFIRHDERAPAHAGMAAIIEPIRNHDFNKGQQHEQK